MSKKVQEEKYVDWYNHRNIYRSFFRRRAYEYAFLQQRLAENLNNKKDNCPKAQRCRAIIS